MRPEGWVRQGARTLRSVARALTRTAFSPVVHPWMTVDAAAVRALARQLDEHLARFDAAVELTRAATASIPGPGPGAGSAPEPGAGPGQTRPAQTGPQAGAPAGGHGLAGAAPGVRAGDEASGAGAVGGVVAGELAGLVRLRAALVETRDAFGELADALDRHGPQVRAALAEVAQAGTDLARIRPVRARIRAHTDALSEADVRCRRRLESAIREVPEGADLVAQLLQPQPARPGAQAALADDSRATAGTAGTGGGAAAASLREADAPSRGEAAAAAGPRPGASSQSAGRTAGDGGGVSGHTTVEAGRTTAAGSAAHGPQMRAAAQRRTVARDTPARRLRRRLLRLDAAAIDDHLRRHPEEIETLAASTRDLDLLPARIPAQLLHTPREEEAAWRRIEERAAAFTAAGEDAMRVALLWPSLVGPLDGAHPQARIAANRLLLRAELGRARRLDVELELRAIARRVADRSRPWQRLRGRLLTAWLTRDRLTSYATITAPDLPELVRDDLRVRIRLYQGLLYDRVRDEAADPSRRIARRPLLFDPSGHGRIAEWWGPPGAEQSTPQMQTSAGAAQPTPQALAVVVPGTGTAVRGFHVPTGIARDLSAATGSVVIAWMGADFPAAIGTQAPFARYALAAARPLRDFVHGIARPWAPLAGVVPIADADSGADAATGTGANPATDGAVDPGIDAAADLGTDLASRPAPRTTVIGHSYGAVVVGAADRLGLPADRIVHVASPGAGPGVHTLADYPTTDPLHRARAPQRYSLTAPGDPVRWVARMRQPGRWLARRLSGQLPRPFTRQFTGRLPRLRGFAWLPRPLRHARLVRGGRWGGTGRVGLGVDLATLPGVQVLSAGVWEVDRHGHRVGEPVAGPSAHAEVMLPGTGAFRRLVEVVTGHA